MNNTGVIYLLTVISFLVGTSQFVIVGVLDKIAMSMGVSISTAGQLITVFALANAIGTPIVIMAAAKMSQPRQLLLALSLVLCGISLMLIFPSFNWLLVSRAVLGVGTGVFIVTAYAIAAKLAPPGCQGDAMSHISMGFSASVVFGVPIGRIVTAAYDWQAIFWIIGFLCMLGCLVVVRSFSTMAEETPLSFNKQASLLQKQRMAAVLGVTLFVFIGYSVVNTYIIPFLAYIGPMSEQEISSILFALGIAGMIGSKLGGFLIDRIGIARTCMGSMVFQALSLFLLSISATFTIITIASLMIWTTSVWIFALTQSFNIVSLVPKASGILLSLNSSFVQLGYAMGAGIGGVAIGNSSIAIISWIGVISVTFALFMSAFFYYSSLSGGKKILG